MRKLAALFLLLALLCGAGFWQLRRWAEQTEGQAAQLRAQMDRSAAFWEQKTAWQENEAAAEALAYRPAEKDGEGVAEYVSPEEIRFVSFSKAWDAESLKALYEELLRNRHGPELNTLERVTVYSEEDEFAAATHQNTMQQVPVAVHFPLVPAEEIFSFLVEGGQISLYGGDEKTSVAEMAPELSHEYGHHYTLSYLLPGGGSNMDLYRDYARLRGLNADNVFVRAASTEQYYRNHKRFLVEIAAEDYVVLMGSPNAMKQIGNYKDIYSYASGERGDVYIERNAAPQENMCLPFATEVPGLAELFYSYLNETPPEYPHAGDVGLQFRRRTESFQLDTGYRTFVSYQLSWEKTLGEDAVYTLICVNPETEMVFPVVTVRSGEPAEAQIGEYWRSTSRTVSWFDDGLTEGTKRFLVVVTLPNGQVSVSDPVEKSF